MRIPNGSVQQPLAWPPMYGDAFGNYYASPRVYFTLTQTIWKLLQQWSQGDFIADLDAVQGRVLELGDVPIAEQPRTLDRAALHWCMGGPFHPGCEMTWPMRRQTMYRAPFRLRERPASLPEPEYGPFIGSDILTLSDGPLLRRD
jgi:hypothetical protein